MLLKLALPLTLILLTLSRCAPPTSTRDFGSFTEVGSGAFKNPSTQDPDSDTDDTPEDTDGYDELDPDDKFTNCDDDYAQQIGYVSACKASESVNQTAVEFRVSFSATNLSPGSCLVPMTEFIDGNQVNQRYIGNHACLGHHADAVYEGTLNKYTNEAAQPMNAVMVLKPNALTDFYNCMNAAADYVSLSCPYYNGNDYYCQNSSTPLRCSSGYNQACLNGASYQRDVKCDYFADRHDYILFNF